MNRPITKKELSEHANGVITGVFPNRAMRRAQRNMLNRSPMTSKNNRKTTEARLWLHNFIKGLWNKMIKSKKVESAYRPPNEYKMSIKEAYYYSKGPKFYQEYLHRKGVDL
jgi:hypothetical protein